MTKKVLMVLTNASEMKDGHKTGLWLSEFGEAYVEFNREGYDITVASPIGGQTPVDARSLDGDVPEEILDTKRHLEDTVDLRTIENFSAYDAIFLPGGHGTMFDLPDSEALGRALRELYEADKTVAAVCHGPAGLVGATLSDGTPLVKGKTIATFTDEEERATGLDIYMPFMLETRLRELGANVVLADNFTANVQVDGKLITGQNPQSTVGVAKAVIDSLNG
ncbi:type 1 glutamine amidotransferase domain-containing protein [Jeotgalibacillus sp. R-1-5s-1]|uniref:type 1 glutamine amidotransferase domain-containing protein n=1 Tax=Jeotgalibacillus sp. R-1-5s-1 TaxID=2555897 RepID=UPI00106D80F7|nr:type 1 glutamine amidotransferase domain-containing protein [Jeotgalibacillus sp. R-1-5s-1]TFD94440.1 type 1 glutamine amidotransferase domain-containing protein [Jeotgalibacillus sp. R-1-5s-1]